MARRGMGLTLPATSVTFSATVFAAAGVEWIRATVYMVRNMVVQDDEGHVCPHLGLASPFSDYKNAASQPRPPTFNHVLLRAISLLRHAIAHHQGSDSYHELFHSMRPGTCPAGHFWTRSSPSSIHTHRLVPSPSKTSAGPRRVSSSIGGHPSSRRRMLHHPECPPTAQRVTRSVVVVSDMQHQNHRLKTAFDFPESSITVPAHVFPLYPTSYTTSCHLLSTSTRYTNPASSLSYCRRDWLRLTNQQPFTLSVNWPARSWPTTTCLRRGWNTKSDCDLSCCLRMSSVDSQRPSFLFKGSLLSGYGTDLSPRFMKRE
jgi:hypothetical protein